MPEGGSAPRIVRAGPGALYLRFDEDPSPDLARRLGAWHGLLYENRIRDIYDVIPAYQSILIEHRPGLSSKEVAAWVERQLAGADDASALVQQPRLHELEVAYGEDADRDALAERLGMSFDDIIAHHTGADYVVAFLGFTAGFPYLLGLPRELHTPRRARPRDRIPAGAVAIAGAQAGIYPSPSPGGWWVLGLTDAKLFEPGREPPALLSAGDTVRFTPVPTASVDASNNAATGPGGGPEARHEEGRHDAPPSTSHHVLVTTAWPRGASLQATPRHGVAHWGMAEAGALDPRALEAANEIVGNPRHTLALEAIGHPVTFVPSTTLRAALAGGGLGARLAGRRIRRWEAFEWPAGSSLELFPDPAVTGYTTYLAVAGGFHGETFRGSASTDARAGIGGAHTYLAPGVSLGIARSGASGKGRPHVGTPRYAERVVLRIWPGPQYEPAAWRRLIGTSFRIAVVDRTGARLTGPRLSLGTHESISEGSPAGAVQVPPDGQPIVLLADRGRTGGYAKPAIVDRRDLWLLAQAGPGTEIWLEPVPGALAMVEPVHWKP